MTDLHESYGGNRHTWSVTLRGDRRAISKRAEAIHKATEDMMIAYCSRSIGGEHEIQMEFMKMEGVA